MSDSCSQHTYNLAPKTGDSPKRERAYAPATRAANFRCVTAVSRRLLIASGDVPSSQENQTQESANRPQRPSRVSFIHRLGTVLLNKTVVQYP